MGYLWRWAGSSGDTIQAGAFRFPGTQGPLDPAAIQSMSFGGGTVTVTTVNNHNVSNDQKILLGVPSDWLPTGNTTGIVSVHVTGAKTFTYAGVSNPVSSTTGSTWNYPIQHALQIRG